MFIFFKFSVLLSVSDFSSVTNLSQGCPFPNVFKARSEDLSGDLDAPLPYFVTTHTPKANAPCAFNITEGSIAPPTYILIPKYE